MNAGKIEAIDMHIDRIVKYIDYTECLMKILYEFIENIENEEIRKYKLYYLALIIYKYIKYLKMCIYNMHIDWEFYENRHNIKKAASAGGNC